MTDTPESGAARAPGAAARLLNSRWTAPALAVAALAAAVVPNLPGVFEARVRGYLLAQPQILEEIDQARALQAQDQRIAALNAAAAANPGVFEPGPHEPVFGPADARITVIEYFDYRCPYCKMIAPAYLEVVRNHPDVRFIFREWPILDRPGEIASQYAARAALLAHQQGRYLEVHQALMAEPSLTPETVDRILAEHGVTLDADRAALESPEVARTLADVSIGARTIGLDATPTLFVNGRALSSNDPAGLAQAIAAAR